jgi:hypothetical protein
MKKLLLIIFVFAISIVNAQFKSDLDNKPSVSSGILNTNSFGSLLGFINPDNFSMHHSFDLSFSSFGGSGNMSLGVYTNSMEYKFSDRLNVQTDISIVNTPYNSFGNDFSKQINGIYLSRAALNFKVSDNMKIFVEYRNVPGGYYSPYGYSGYSSFYRDSFSNAWGF